MTISLKGTLVLVGAGKMGGAMLEGWIKSGVEPKQVVALDPEGGRHVLGPAELGFGYRHSKLPLDWIVIGAALRGVPGEPQAIEARMRAIKAEREATQPLHVATGGSTFKNPGGRDPNGVKAWRLIDAAGCRGLRYGRAMVSDKHCNFLINTGGARAAELEQLGEQVRARVEEQSGIRLEWEIDRIGRKASASSTDGWEATA